MRSLYNLRISQLAQLSLLTFLLLTNLSVWAQPTNQATNLVFYNGGGTNSLNISWNNGNGSNRLVVMTTNNGVFSPINGTDYTLVANDVNANYSTANDKDPAAGVAKLVYAGTGSSFTVTGLTGNTHYRVKIYEFAAAGFLYNTAIASGSFQGVWFYTNTASTTNYTVPTGASSLTVKAWGAGAGGGDASTAGNGGAGGGGGAYASSTFASVLGAVHVVTAGGGGIGGDPNGGPLLGTSGGSSSFGSTVIAAGGSVQNGGVTGGSGGQAGSSTGTTKFSGGNGGNGGSGANEGGGGGGSSASSGGNGVDGGNFSGNQGGSFGNGPDGDGGEGGDDDGASSPNTAGSGTFPGGGGGGRGDTNGGSGAGAGGLVIVSYVVDSTPPTTLQVGAVTSTGGNVVSSYYNNTNTGIDISVPLASDVTLVGGNIQIRIDDDNNGTYSDVGTAVTILADNTTQVVSLTEAQLAATTEFVNPGANSITFVAVVTDAAGNSSTYTASLSTITRDETAPATPSVPDLIVGSDSGSSNTDNNTNDNTPTFDVNSNTAGILLEILANGTSVVSNATSAGAVEQLTASTLSDNTYTIVARVTDAVTGSQSTSANMAGNLTIDTNPPPAPTGLDLTTDSGTNTTDDITNDNTPSFNATGTSGFRLEILDGATPVANIASASGSSQSLTTSTLADGAHSITARTTDVAGNTSSTAVLSVTIDTVKPDVTVNQKGATPDPAFSAPVFTVVFNEPIETSTFISGDLTVNAGTQTGESVSAGPTEVAPNNGTTFEATVTATGTTPGTIVVTLPAGNVQDVAGNINNISTSTDNSVTFTPEPSTPPTGVTLTAVSQFAMTVNRAGGNGTTYLWVARAGAAVDFVPVDGTDYTSNANLNFNAGTAIDGNGNKILAVANNASRNVTGLDENTTYYFAVFALHGTGANLNYNTTGTTASQATSACVFPTAPTNFSSSTTTSTATLNFDRASVNDEFLILLKSGGIPVSTPVGGADYTSIDNLNFASAGALGDAFVVYSGEYNNSTTAGLSRTITNLAIGTSYGYRIYTYNPSTFCYQATHLSGTVTTSATASAELTLAVGALSEPGTISSLGTALTGAVGPQTNAVQNFDFIVQDGADGAQVFISQIVISKGVNDQIADWSQAISAVSLTDGTNTQTANITIGANTITIASISTALNALGNIASGASKTYTLTIALKIALGGTLPTNIDGKQFDFLVNTAGIAAGGGGSTMAAAQTTSSGLNKNVVDVTASKITVATQPSAAAIANIALGTQPKFVSQDANNNTDTGFNFGLTVGTTPSNLGPASAPANFTNGVVDFAASGFKFLTPGTATMNVVANSITSANTNSITVTSTSTLGAAASGITSNASALGNGLANVVVLGFSLQTNGSSHNVSGLTFTTPVNPGALMTNFRIYSNSSDSFSLLNTLESSTATPGATSLNFSGLTIPINSTVKYFWLVADIRSSYLIATPASIDFALTMANVTEALVGTTKVGSNQNGLSYNIKDTIAPTISSITLPNANPNRSGTVNFTVTFSEAVTITDDLDFLVNGTAATGTPTHSGSGTTYTVAVSGISAEGTLGLTVVNDNGSIQDLAGNMLNVPPAGVSSPSQYYVYVQEPTSSVSSFQITTTTTTSMTLTWTDVATFPAPIAYLITAERSGATATVPVDLNDYADQTDLINNTTGYLMVAPGTQTATFSSLLSGANYTFYIYPYTNISPNSDYRTTSAATVSGASLVASNSQLNSSGPLYLITDFSSLNTAYLAPTSQNPPATLVPTPNFFWAFVEDNGLDGPALTGDNAKTLITQIVISGGPNNNISNWNDVIAEAKLRAFGGTLAAPTEDTFVTTTNITGNTITFSSLPIGNDQTGEVDDNELKYYQLYIKFKGPIDNTNLLRQTIDNKNFDFQVTNTSFSYTAGSSKVNTATNINTNSGTTRNIVRVSPTELRFVQQPTTNTYIGNVMSPLVSIEATDIYGTRDLDYGTPVNINSTGTLATIPTPVAMASGIGSASVIHSDRGTNLTLTGSATGLTSTPSSNPFDIIIANASDIVLDGTFSETQNIQYANFQSANIATLPASSQGVTIARFTLRDGGATVDTDGSPTILKDITFNISNVGALRKVALYDGTIEIAELPATSPLTFNNINYSTLTDGGTRNFNVVVTFLNTSAAITDNAQVRFTITNATTTSNSSDFAAANAGGAQSSITGNENRIEVTASQYVFTNPTLPKNIFAAITATATPGFGTITVEARDANNILDLDYGQTANITNVGAIPMTDNPPGSSTSLTSIPYTFASGVLTFSTGFKYDQPGDGTLRVTEQSAAPLPAAAIPQKASNTISVVVSSSSDIVTDGSFDPTDNIAYTTYQAANINLASPGDELKVAQFILQDGGADRPGIPNDADNTGTELTAITFNVSNASFINKLALYNQANTLIQEITVPLAATTVTFTGYSANSIVANDGGNTSFSLYATFRNTITDNQQIQFTVNSATANALKSTLKNPDGSTAGSPAFTSIAGNDNRMEVLATRLTFTTVPTTASINVPFAVTVTAQDINGNTDADYAGNVSFGSYPNGNTAGFATANLPSGAFTAGIKSYPANFNFTAGNSNTQLAISGSSSNGAGPFTDQLSPNISVVSSFESRVYATMAPQAIPYINFQSTNIDQTAINTGNAFIIEQLVLSDGDADGVSGDLDGANTQLTDITLGVTNPQAIRRIGIYTRSGVGPLYTYNELGEVAGSSIVVDGGGYGTVIFTGFTVDAVDPGGSGTGTTTIYVVVSFLSSNTAIVDNRIVQVSVTDAQTGVGSKFRGAPGDPLGGVGNFIGGVTKVNPPSQVGSTVSGSVYAGTVGAANSIQVVATRLDFVKQPGNFAGINQPIDTTAIVHARDIYAVLDVDFNTVATVSSAALSTPLATAFTNGVLDLSFMQYTLSGNGKLDVAAGTLNSNSPSIICENVDVIHVNATKNTNGVVDGNKINGNLKAATTNQVILGFTLKPERVTTSQPRLKEFLIEFKTEYPWNPGAQYSTPYKTSQRTILQNFKLRMSSSANPSASTATAVSPTIVDLLQEEQCLNCGFDRLRVKFKTAADYQALFNGTNSLTFYLVADISSTANGSVQPLRAALIDNGYPDVTDSNIKTTFGSATANVLGTLYSFSTVKPPVLISSVPANGQLNVEPNLDSVLLVFDTKVTSLDGVVILWDRATNTPIDTLDAIKGKFIDNTANGQAPNLPPQVSDTLIFKVNVPLLPDSLYYITVAKGNFNINDHSVRSGITDQDLNMYGGITFNGALYFKAASSIPPQLKQANAYQYGQDWGILNASFDKFGKAYYMILPAGSPAPTNAQIKGASIYLGALHRGSFDIKKLHPVVNQTVINASLGGNTYYDIWMYAENDALPTRFSTSSPYGAQPSYGVGQPGPTLTIYAQDYASLPYYYSNNGNYPYVEVCANSPTVFNQPIVIAETQATDFSPKDQSNNYQSGVYQTLNIVLPNGFQFITSKKPTVSFIGSDFDVNSNNITFVNSTILSIGYYNSYYSNGISLDRIIISDITIQANSPDIGGSIQTIGGNTFGVNTYLGYVASIASNPIDFTNSFSVRNSAEFNQPPISFSGSVNFIPDNYLDPSLNENAVRLLPQPTKGDYGLSIFSGLGRSDDKMVLSAVDKNSAFSISMVHTDNNGCSTTKTTQYLVYDHTAAISGVVDIKNNNANKRIKKAIYNPNAPLGLANNPIVVADSISRNGLAGFKLLNLVSKVPSYATRYDSTDLVHAITDQILFDSIGLPWNNLISKIPVLKNSQFDFALGDSTRSYFQNFNVVHNARSLSGNAIPNPYVWFAEPLTPRRKRPFRGGSLGKIEFTGLYQSTADVTLKSPIRQELELFLPALPVVEHVTDPSWAYPSLAGGIVPIYCASSTGNPADVQDIQIAGYPQAAAGVTNGYFTIYDSAAYASLIAANQDPAPSKLNPSPSDFTDNANGTASLKTSFHNQGKTMRIEYTLYEAVDSVWTGRGSFHIRITPNPIGQFNFVSPQALLPNASRIDDIYNGRPYKPFSFCEDNTIAFINTSSFSNAFIGTYTAQFRPDWSLGDPLDGRSIRTDRADSVHFKYKNPGQYDVNFQVRSNYNCPSQVIIQQIAVGAIPVPDFSLNGVGNDVPIVVSAINTSLPRFTSVTDATGSNSEIDSIAWFYGDSTVVSFNQDPRFAKFRTKPNHKYITPGHYKITLWAVTSINSATPNGCEIMYSRPVIVLPFIDSVQVAQYSEDFEDANPLKQWQTSAPLLDTAWTPGVASISTTGRGWYTKAAIGEHALYSAAFDFHKLMRPMISLDRYTDMGTFAGVAIDFSVDSLNVADSSKKWFRLGTSTSGVNWYNKSDIASSPGSQTNYQTKIESGSFGWDKSNNWELSSHTLSPDIPAVKPQTHVVFRFSFASNNDVVSPDNGFALDNFRVGERTRVVLVENFTNLGSSNPAERIQTDFLQRDFNPIGLGLVDVGVDYVKLNYHVGFPQEDPFNLDNPSDPSSRALYYGVSSTPKAVMDGIKSAQVTDAIASYNERTLDLAGAKLSFVEVDSTADGGYKAKIKVRALKSLPTSTLLHVVLAEKKIVQSGLSTAQLEKIALEKGDTSSYEYVVRKMIPSASGTIFTNALDNDSLTLAIDSIQTFPSSAPFDFYKWKLDKIYKNPDDMVVIAFLQDEGTRQIHQAIMSPLLPNPPTITGIETPFTFNEISIYPNPADHELNIVFPNALEVDVPIVMADQMGRITHNMIAKKGDQSVILNTEGVSQGLYILQINLGEGKIGRSKVIINHKE